MLLTLLNRPLCLVSDRVSETSAPWPLSSCNCNEKRTMLFLDLAVPGRLDSWSGELGLVAKPDSPSYSRSSVIGASERGRVIMLVRTLRRSITSLVVPSLSLSSSISTLGLVSEYFSVGATSVPRCSRDDREGKTTMLVLEVPGRTSRRILPLLALGS